MAAGKRTVTTVPHQPHDPKRGPVSGAAYTTLRPGSGRPRAIEARLLALATMALALPALSPATSAAQERTAFERCVDVQIGAERTLDCLNDEFRQRTERLRSLPTLAPLDARSQDIRIGTVNQAALRQQYGKNLGLSVVPYRPSPFALAPRR